MLIIKKSLFTAWFLALFAVQPVPCDVAAWRIGKNGQIEAVLAPLVPVPGPGIVVNNATLPVAMANRTFIEAGLANGGLITLPAGTIHIDRGIRLVSGCTLAGLGAGRTILHTAFDGQFGDSSTVQVLQGASFGLGYASPMLFSGNVVTITDGSEGNYTDGSWIFTWKWDGYATTGAQTRVHQVLHRAGNQLTLDVAPAAGSDAANWMTAAIRIAGANEGRLRLSVASVLPKGMIPGSYVRITAGPSVGNETVGEVRRIVSVDAQMITLDRPLRQTYPQAISIAVLISPVVGATVRDLTIAAPVNGQVPPVFVSQAVRFTLESCDVAGDVQVALCSDVLIRDCRLTQTINLNGSQDVRAVGCRCRAVYIEEGCSDVTIQETLVSGSPTCGVQTPGGSPSERITLRCVSIEAAGDSPVALTGRECVVDNVAVRGSQPVVPWIASYLSGDGLRVRDLRSDLPTVVKFGSGISLTGIRGPLTLGWVLPTDQPTGACIDCGRPDVSKLTPATLAAWAFVAQQAAP